MTLRKGSRYEQVGGFTPGENGTRFLGTRPRPIVPADGVLEHRVKAGERIDLLALYYYNDTRKWWRILDANPHIVHGGDLTLDRHLGQILVIPNVRGKR